MHAMKLHKPTFNKHGRQSYHWLDRWFVYNTTTMKIVEGCFNYSQANRAKHIVLDHAKLYNHNVYYAVVHKTMFEFI